MRLPRREYLAPLVFLLLPAIVFASSKRDLRTFEANAPFVETRGTITQWENTRGCKVSVTYTVEGVSRTNRVGNVHLCAHQHGSLGKDVRVWHSTRDPDYISLVPETEALDRMNAEIAGLTWFPALTLILYLPLAMIFGSREDDDHSARD